MSDTLNDSSGVKGVSRRSLALGAVWAAPAIALAPAAPAFAASKPVGSWGTICRIFYGDGTVNAQRMEVRLGFQHDGSGYKLNQPYTFVFNFDKAVGTPTISASSFFSSTVTPSNGGRTITVKITFTTAPTTNPYCGSIAINWDPGTQVLPPETTVTASATGPNSTATASQLSWKVPQRYDGTTSNNKPHYYISRWGAQTCYPETRYSYFSKSSSSWTACGVDGNDTSTVYPGGSCQRLSLTTGSQNSLPAVC